MRWPLAEPRELSNATDDSLMRPLNDTLRWGPFLLRLDPDRLADFSTDVLCDRDADVPVALLSVLPLLNMLWFA